MRRLSRLLSFLLLTAWFPVTQHCSLEAAGLLAQGCADNCVLAQTHSVDGCGAVEAGLYKASADAIKVPAPELLACDGFFFLQISSLVEFVEPALVPVGAVERPLDWVTMWRFVRRAAPPSRAPAFLCA